MFKEPVTFVLETPVVVNGDEIKQIILQKPRGRHIKGLGTNPSLKDLLDIAAQISGNVPKLFDEMDASDCLKIAGIIGGFLGNGPEIGKT